MHLIFCTSCEDVVALHTRERKCMCGKSAGRYKAANLVEISGLAMPLSFTDAEFKRALVGQPHAGSGFRFGAAVMAKTAPSVQRKV